jgi:uncharacterized membrane protein YedE/YeeE
MNIIIALAIGFVFGFVLQRVGLADYDKIINQFRFRDNTMMKFMFSAITVGSFSYFLLKDFGFEPLPTVHYTYILGNLFGGIVFGTGMALAGTCPGTVIAGIGQGNIDYLFAGVAGFISGAVVFSLIYPDFFSVVHVEYFGKIAMENIVGIGHWFFVSLFAIICILILNFSKYFERGSKDVN